MVLGSFCACYSLLFRRYFGFFWFLAILSALLIFLYGKESHCFGKTHSMPAHYGAIYFPMSKELFFPQHFFILACFLLCYCLQQNTSGIPKRKGYFLCSWWCIVRSHFFIISVAL